MKTHEQKALGLVVSHKDIHEEESGWSTSERKKVVYPQCQETSFDFVTEEDIPMIILLKLNYELLLPRINILVTILGVSLRPGAYGSRPCNITG